MNRCFKFSYAIFSIAICALLTGAATTFSSQARAQAQMQTMHRNFPKAALRGELTVTAPPAIELDGRADRLSPGARIHDAQNMLAMSGALVGQALTVNYLRDAAGLVSEVWILSPEEARERRAAARSARNFVFGSETDSTPRDDGKTPFNQLPVYPQQ